MTRERQLAHGKRAIEAFTGNQVSTMAGEPQGLLF